MIRSLWKTFKILPAYRFNFWSFWLDGRHSIKTLRNSSRLYCISQSHLYLLLRSAACHGHWCVQKFGITRIFAWNLIIKLQKKKENTRSIFSAPSLTKLESSIYIFFITSYILTYNFTLQFRSGYILISVDQFVVSFQVFNLYFSPAMFKRTKLFRVIIPKVICTRTSIVESDKFESLHYITVIRI